jgi:hypothetical protein
MPTETQIVREAPFLEKARQDLLKSAQDITTPAVTLPQQQLAPFSAATTQAFNLGQQGIGGYQPYLQQQADLYGQPREFSPWPGPYPGPGRYDRPMPANVRGGAGPRYDRPMPANVRGGAGMQQPMGMSPPRPPGFGWWPPRSTGARGELERASEQIPQAERAFWGQEKMLYNQLGQLPAAQRNIMGQESQLPLAGQALIGQEGMLGAQGEQLGAAGGALAGQAAQLGQVDPVLQAQQARLAQQGIGLGAQAGQLGLVEQSFAPQQQQLGVAGAELGSAAGQLAGGEGILGGLAGRGGLGRLEEARMAAYGGAGDITDRISNFQDPYQQQVMEAFNVEADRQAAMARSRAGDRAVQAGAFGGSRSGIEAAEIERNLADVKQRNMAQLLSGGYGQALGAAEREAGRKQQLPGQLMGIEQLQYGLPSGVASQLQQAAAGRQNLAAGRQALAQGYGGLGSQRQALAQAYGGLAGGYGQLGTGYGQLGAGRQALGQAYGQLGAGRQALAGGYGQLGAGYGQLGAGRQALGQAYGQAAAGRQALGQGYGQVGAGFGQLAAGRQALAGTGQQLAGGYQSLGGAMGGLAQLSQQLPAQDVAMLSQIGAQQQQQAQRAYDTQRQNILQQTYEPYQRVSYMSDILKGVPSVQSKLTQGTGPSANPLSTALGAGISLAGIFGPSGFGSGYMFNPNSRVS